MTPTSVETQQQVDAAGDAREIAHLDWAPALRAEAVEGAGEPASPARHKLPWALLLGLLDLVAVGYAAVLGMSGVLTGMLVVLAAVLGAVCGLSVRDGRDRWVSAPRALGDGLRRLGRALWH